jgi:WD40 repeat protein
MKRALLLLLPLSLLACTTILINTDAAFVPAALAQQAEVRDARYYSDQALKAYREKNYPAYLENMKRALELRPEHPRLMYNLASAHALVGNRAEAVRLLGRVAEMGLIFAAERDTDFDSIRATDEFKAVLRRFDNNRAPVNHSTVAFTLKEKGLVTEGIAYDPTTETFYLSSVHKRKIVSFARDGTVQDFATEREGLWSVLGMKVDAARRHLWVTTGALPQMTGYSEAEKGRSAIFKFDLGSGKLLKKYLLMGPSENHLLGDLVVSSRGDVFATDSASPGIYRIDRRKDELELFIKGEPFVSAQGLDFSADERQLFVADYSRGIFVVDLQSRKAVALTPAPGTTLLGIDGLYFYKDALTGTQNGTNPHRIIRLHLKKDLGGVERLEILEANNPLFDEPTLGVRVRDTFYYIANSQWGAVDDKGQLAPAEKLREPVILKVKL